MSVYFKQCRWQIFLGVLSFGVVCASVCFVLMRFHQPSSVPQSNVSPSVVQPVSATTPTDPQVDLTPKQKIAQMITVSIRLSESQLENESEFLQKLQPGFVVIYGRSISHETMKSASTQLKLLEMPFPLLLLVDHEGGYVQRLSGEEFTDLDTWEEMCQKDPDELRRDLTASAAELHSAGIDIILGPVADFSDQTSEAMATRLCLGDLDFVTERTQEFLDAFVDAGVTPTMKHFPGIGSLRTDLHDGYEQVKAGNTDRAIFDQLLEKNPKIAIMTSHAGLPNENIPCSLSKKCLELLSPHSQVLILTDDVDMMAVDTVHSKNVDRDDLLAERVKLALEAGNNVVLLGPEVKFSEVEMIVSLLAEEYAQNSVFAERVDQNFLKITEWRSTR